MGVSRRCSGAWPCIRRAPPAEAANEHAEEDPHRARAQACADDRDWSSVAHAQRAASRGARHGKHKASVLEGADGADDWLSIALLSLAYACNFSTMTIAVATTTLASANLAADISLRTLAVACMFYCMGLANVFMPAELRKWGRTAAYLFGATIGCAGCCILALALFLHSFKFICVGNAMLGVSVGHAMNYRFAAVSLAPSRTSGAIAAVLAGGVLGAALGPGALARARKLLATDFMAIYVLSAGMNALGGVFLCFVRFVEASSPQKSKSISQDSRSLATILACPRCWVSIVGGFSAYSIMMMVMAATPLAMHEMFGHSYLQNTGVIAVHMVMMFAPSFLTGWCVDRISPPAVMLLGSGLFFIAHGILSTGSSLKHFFIGMGFLGVAFNVLYVASTIQITKSCNSSESAKVQAVNDGVMWFITGSAAISSGPLIKAIGWNEALVVGVGLTIGTTATVVFQLLYECHFPAQAECEHSETVA